jgi:serpin B
MLKQVRISLLSFPLLLVTTINGCATTESPEATPPEPTEVIPPEATEVIPPIEAEVTLPPKAPVEKNPAVTAINQFTTDLYAQLIKSPTTDNLFFSPYSISVALAMTYAGAGGTTKEQMAKALFLNLEDNRIHDSFGQLERSLTTKTDDHYQLAIANKLWVQKEKTLLVPEFTEILNEKYHTSIKTADFEKAHEIARQEINQWIAEKTEQKIPELLAPNLLTPQTKLVLTNAVYFKGKWQYPFDSTATENQTFVKLDGSKLQVPMMYQKEKLPYFEDEQVHMIELPYKGDAISMTILLPKKEDKASFEAVEAQLANYLNRPSLHQDHKPEKVAVYLPRFQLESAFSLQEMLQQLGMTDAFAADKADFSKMVGTANKLAISAVIHKAFVDVNEEGTEAAAATGVVTSRGRSLVFHADHPFIFWIKDKREDVVLFLGKVVNPSVPTDLPIPPTEPDGANQPTKTNGADQPAEPDATEQPANNGKDGKESSEQPPTSP